MLNNILYIADREDLVVIAKDKGLINTLQTVSTKIPRKDSKVKDAVVFCEKVLSDSKPYSLPPGSELGSLSINYLISCSIVLPVSHIRAVIIEYNIICRSFSPITPFNLFPLYLVSYTTFFLFHFQRAIWIRASLNLYRNGTFHLT